MIFNAESTVIFSEVNRVRIETQKMKSTNQAFRLFLQLILVTFFIIKILV